jgi:hypothetical protein
MVDGYAKDNRCKMKICRQKKNIYNMLPMAGHDPLA